MFKRKGQNLVEVVTIFAIVSLVLVAMQMYVKRGIQGQTKVLTDQIIDAQQRAYVSETESSKTTIESVTPDTVTVQTAPGGSIAKTVGGTTHVHSHSSADSK